MADDAVFQEAMDALREGNKARARELLTGLIKEDQNNAEYWIWLSAAMDTAKERIYCLQTALKLDPENASAKRGLILLGVIPADESIQPFSVNRPRKWEEKLLLAHEKPKLKGWAAIKASPVVRLGLVILLVGAIASGVTFGFLIPAANRRAARPPTSTPGPSPTYTLTVTPQGGRPQTQVVGTPQGLAEVLGIQYTATPLYVEVERSPLTSDLLLQFNNAFAKGDWDEAISALLQVIDVVTRYDEVVVPYTSGFLAGDRSTNITLQDRCPADPAEHLTIPLDRQAIAWVLEAFDREGPADPTAPIGCL